MAKAEMDWGHTCLPECRVNTTICAAHHCKQKSQLLLKRIPEWVPAASETAREDGERFEAVIILEGMEETVQYEHIVRGDLGFEMDYDYESFERYSDPELESFLSAWDGPGNPENFFEVTFSGEDE